MSAVRHDTRAVPIARRSGFWRDVVYDMLQLESESTPIGSGPLETTVAQHALDNLSVAVVRGGAQEVVVHGRQRNRATYVIFPASPGGFVEVDDVRRLLLPEHAYFVNTTGPTRIQTVGRFEHLSLSVPLASLDRTLPLLGAVEPGPLVLDGTVAKALAVALRSLCVDAPDIAADAAPSAALSMVELLNAALLERLGTRARHLQGSDAHHRQRIRDYALARLSDPELGVESIAAGVALSTRRIHQLFADSGMTLMRWIWSERLARAHGQLLACPASRTRIGEIGYEWGFSDPAHFSRVFRRRYGVSPRQLKTHAPDASITGDRKLASGAASAS